MDLNDRICRYLAACPPAVSGQGGHDQTFSVACALYQGFSLTETEVLGYLKLWNDRCQPPWEEKDLLHKAKQAAKAQHSKVKGYLLGSEKFSKEDYRFNAFPAKPPEPKPLTRIDPVTAIEVFLRGFSCGEAELYDASPVKPSEDFTMDGVLLLRHLFRPGEIVNFVTRFKMESKKDGTEKARPDGMGESVVREALMADWELAMPVSEAGGWLRMNPVDGQGVADKNITACRYILLEFDNIPVELQLCLFGRLPLPIACLMTSGGKSIHAWIRDDAPDVTSYKDDSQMLLKMLERFGFDGKNKNPGRLSRLPGVVRKIDAAGDGRQRLLYLNPNPTQSPILP